MFWYFFFQAEDGIRDVAVTGVQTCALPISPPEQLGHDPTRVGALRQTVAVLAVRRDRVVVGAQHGRRADGHRLLANIQVEEAADLAERVALRSLLLEATDQHHLRQELPRQPGIHSGRRRVELRHSASRYQRIALRSSTDNRRRRRKIATMMARPTATSAAATVMTKNTSTCPSALPNWAPNATSARLAAFSITSIDMKITSGSRRTMTPTAP